MIITYAYRRMSTLWIVCYCSAASFHAGALPQPSQSVTIRDRASTSCLTCCLTFVSPVKPPTSPEMPSMCSIVLVRVIMLSRKARTFSEVSTCTVGDNTLQMLHHSLFLMCSASSICTCHQNVQMYACGDRLQADAHVCSTQA